MPRHSLFPTLLANPAVLHRVPVSPCLLDNFTGTGVLTAHTPDISPAGSAWAILSGSFGSLSGGYLPYGSGNYGGAVIDCGLADLELRYRAKYYSAADGAFASGVNFRSSAVGYGYGTGTEYYSGKSLVGWNCGGIAVHPDQVSGGYYPFTMTNGQYYTWKLVLKGAMARLFDDSGNLILAAQEVGNLTNTYVGLYNQHGYGNWDFIEVKPLTRRFQTFSVMGDSISDGAGEWPGITSCNINNGYGLVYNHAQSGAVVSHMASQGALCIADNADYIICALGTNDSSNVHAAYESHLITIYGSLGKPIYCMGVLPKSPEGSRADRNAEISAAVADAQAAGVNATYWNTDGWIDPATDTSDGLHPTFAGQTKIAAEVVSRL